MLVGGVVLLMGSVASGEHLDSIPPLEGWFALAYLTCFGSIVAFNAYMYLLKHVRPAAATSYAYVNPAVAVALGSLLLDEPLSPPELVGGAVIIAAVAVVISTEARNLRRQPQLPT
jgi:drug/metabolite transporter (DMT)-like permease